MSRASKQLATHASLMFNRCIAKRLPIEMLFLMLFILLTMASNSYSKTYFHIGTTAEKMHASYAACLASIPAGHLPYAGIQYADSACQSGLFYEWREHQYLTITMCNVGYCTNSGLASCDIPGQTRNNQGVCNCPTGQTVVNGSCTVTCPAGYVVSGTSCIPNTSIKIEKNLGPTECGVGNPILPNIANKVAIETDYQGPASSPLHMSRIYNSQGVGLVGWRGNGWTHTYSASITTLNNTSVRVQRADGQRLLYTLTNGVWTADSDVAWILSQQKNADGSTRGWTLMAENDQTEHYDATGKLISLKNRAGYTQTLTYVAGLLIQVSDTFGKQLNFSYNAAGQMTGMTDPADHQYRYSYDGNGNLKTVTYPDDTPADLSDNPKKTYVYGSDPGEIVNTGNVSQPNALTGIIDENGVRYATYRYDSAGKAISTEHAGGVEQYRLDYAADGSQTRITDPLGSVSTTHFTPVLGVVKATGSDQPGGTGCSVASSTQTHDANSNVASRTDFNGHLSCYAYDLSRNLETLRIEGLPAGSTCPANLSAYPPPNGSSIRKISSQWHADYRLPIQIDQAGRRLTWTYDGAGNPLTQTVTDTASQQSRSWHYTYNNLGQVLSADGPRTDVNDLTTYSYYTDTAADHHPGDLKSVTNALGHVTTFNAYDAHGRPLTLIDPNGLITHLNYDARGRLIQKNVGGNLTSYQYDAVGNLIKTTQPSGTAIRYSYDAAHRLTDIQDAAGNSIHYTLDAMGNRIHEDIVDPAGHLIAALSRAVDALNRVQNVMGGQ